MGRYIYGYSFRDLEDGPFAFRHYLLIGRRFQASAEWTLFPQTYRTMNGISIGRGNRSLKASLQIPFLFRIWLELDAVLPFGTPRELSVSFHGWSLWLRFFSDPMGDIGTCLHIGQWIFGRAKYSDETIETREIEVPMPERSYKATARLFRSTWTYPRWFKKSVMRVDIQIPEGIPFEGKSENSYDCGIDRSFGMTTSARSIAEGVGNLVGSVLHDRVRHGGWSDWHWHKEEKEASV